MPPTRSSTPWFPRRIVLLCIVVAALAALLSAASRWASRFAKGQLVSLLREHYESHIEVPSLSISFLPSVRVTGEALVFRHKGRTDVPPLVKVRRFTADAGLLGFLAAPKRVRRLRLEGLEIRVPPRRDHTSDEKNRETQQRPKRPRFVFDKIVADGTLLQILPKKAGKEPLTFDIHRLTLESAGVDRPMHYRSELRNAKPPGLIRATGEFGPWYGGDPGRTPVSGKYTFDGADLGVFHGISGTLSSTGGFKGVLERIDVEGQTDTPDFVLEVSGNRVHLKTQFSATVDGTDGDTLLHPVKAQFLNSTVIANGGVTGTPGVHGKTVSLDAGVENGRLEDVLRLGVKSGKPPMTGIISFHAKLEIPPGNEDIVQKLYLKGAFGIESARFKSLRIEEQVRKLSEKGRGLSEGESGGDVVSNLRGRFVLRDGVIALSGLSFTVPGVAIRLNGTYALRSEELNFRGTARLEAKLSQTTTGIKSFLLKALDPFFKRKGAGAVIPIRITGTRGHASFGLDL